VAFVIGPAEQILLSVAKSAVTYSFLTEAPRAHDFSSFQERGGPREHLLGCN